MNAIPTTTVAVLRDSPDHVDRWGDPTDADLPVQVGIPASLMEQNRMQDPPSGGTPRSVIYTVCRLPAGTDVTGEDRIRDESNSQVYQIDDVVTLSSPVNTPDLKLLISRVSK